MRRRYINLTARHLLLVFSFSIVALPGSSWFGASPAEAQISSTKVMVLDFDTASGIDPQMGRKAADALAVEMSVSGKYDIVSREQVLSEAGAQGLTFPLDTLSQLRVAERLDAKGILTGRVYLSNVSTKPPRAKVEIAVTHTDVAAGEPVNGARTVGDTGAKLGQVDPAALIDEAVSKAAYGAVQSMAITKLPHGIVQILDQTNEITLNIGARDGVSPGMRMMVTREEWDPEKKKLYHRRIGDINIIDVEPAHSTAKSVGGVLGIQTGDKVRAVFETPATALAGGVPRQALPRKAPKGIFSAAVAPLLGLVLFLGGASSNPTTAASEGISASADQHDGLGSTVVVRWGIPSGVPNERVAGHLVHRGSSQSFAPSLSNVIDVTEFARTSYTDTEQDFTDTVTFEVFDDSGGRPKFLPPQHDREDNPTRGRQNQGGGSQTYDAEVDHLPLERGVSVFYAVTRITAQQPPLAPPQGGGTGGGGGGGQTGTGDSILVSSQIGNVSGGSTPLDKATLISPPEGRDFDFSDGFKFITVKGADLYQIQIARATDPAFSSPFRSPELSNASKASGTFKSPDPPIKRDDVVRALGLDTNQSSELIWRVGARNTNDTLRPGQFGFRNDQGYVFSDKVAFTIPAGPPVPPRSTLSRKDQIRNRLQEVMQRLSPEQRRHVRAGLQDRTRKRRDQRKSGGQQDQ
ncbi:MAG: hypothetical protein HY318_13165 [Armatimonadetes bacterium]|nr:hypothetical protein [Armatimonadota bacterium]